MNLRSVRGKSKTKPKYIRFKTRYLKFDMQGFSSLTRLWSLEKIGLLMRIVHRTWYEQKPIDGTDPRRELSVDPRTMRRLYDDELRNAVVILTSQRTPLDDYDRMEVLKKSDGVCYHCGCALPSNWHIDHLVPVVRGGLSPLENLVASCPPCNLRKGGR